MGGGELAVVESDDELGGDAGDRGPERCERGGTECGESPPVASALDEPTCCELVDDRRRLGVRSLKPVCDRLNLVVAGAG